VNGALDDPGVKAAAVQKVKESRQS
jgi:hypothetical protein